MELLRILTLVYAGILVAALAVSLIAILVYLRRIAAVLADVQHALARAGSETEPFEAPLSSLEQAADETSAALQEAGTDLSHADEGLKTLAARRGLLASQS